MSDTATLLQSLNTKKEDAFNAINTLIVKALNLTDLIEWGYIEKHPVYPWWDKFVPFIVIPKCPLCGEKLHIENLFNREVRGNRNEK